MEHWQAWRRGQILHGEGLDRSAETTVQERMGRIKGATMEIKTIIEEFQMQAIGGMMAAWELWERALIPSLLSGVGTWFGLKKCKKAIEMCDSLQNYFWRVMLTVPESCPKIALRCETGMMGMKWRIWREKIMLMIRILKMLKCPHCGDMVKRKDQLKAHVESMHGDSNVSNVSLKQHEMIILRGT